jgi:hypothetical protein
MCYYLTKCYIPGENNRRFITSDNSSKSLRPDKMDTDKILQWTFQLGQNVTVDVVNLDIRSRQQ